MVNARSFVFCTIDLVGHMSYIIIICQSKSRDPISVFRPIVMVKVS